MTRSGRICFIATLCCAGIASASTPSLWLEWQASGDPSTPLAFNPADFGDITPDQNGGMVYTGSLLGDTWQLSWTTRVRNEGLNAYLDTGISVINLSESTQDFSLDTKMSLSDPLTNPEEVDLAASLALTNTDFTGNAAITANAGQSIIEAGLNGTGVDDLFQGPYSLEASGPFASVVDSAATSFMAPTDVLNEISLLTSFNLSPGDLLNITIVMAVQNIPAPGVLPAILLAAGFIGSRSRRRAPESMEGEGS